VITRALATLSVVNDVILSPHLDDAVLSCWHVLDGRSEVTVVNVFTGSPPQGAPVAYWDRLTGARDSVQRMRERHAEDRRAMAMTGRRALHLDLLDKQYRRGDPCAEQLRHRLVEVLDPHATVWAPAGLRHHRDHELVRDAALELAEAGWSVAIYADLPHGIRRGWPGWVADADAGGCREVDGEWHAVLADAGLVVERLVPRVHPLDARARARKLRALDAYRTQRAALDALTFTPLADPRALAFEVAWAVPRSALGRAHEAGGETLVTDTGGDALHERA
jgi:hypothetical protein